MNEIKKIIRKYYITFLDREPDSVGLEHHHNLIRSGKLKIQDLEEIFKNSDEYKTRIVGDMRRSTIQQEKTRKIIKVVGLSFVISLCLVFFIEYIETLKRIEKVRKQT